MIGQMRENECTSGTEATLEALSFCELTELLFCSTLQPSQHVDAAALGAALTQSLRAHHGKVRECAEELAASYGKDPDVACLRMRWARTVVSQNFGVVAG